MKQRRARIVYIIYWFSIVVITECPEDRMSDKGNSNGKKREAPPKSKFREYLEIVVTAVVLALIVRALVVQSYHIPSESMEDTLLKGDFLFASKFIYGARIPMTDYRLPAIKDPKPGDIIIFKYPRDGKTDYIKRCDELPVPGAVAMGKVRP